MDNVPPAPFDLAPYQSGDFLQLVLNTYPDPIFTKDLKHRWTSVNQAFCDLLGRSRIELIGHSDADVVAPEQCAAYWRLDDEVFATGAVQESEDLYTDPAGVERTTWTRKFPLRDAAGAIIGLCGIVSDITALKHREQAAAALAVEVANQGMLLADQEALLAQLSVPVINVWEGVVLLPLMGGIDHQRAMRITEDLLAAVAEQRALFVILDVTGVPVIDSAVASYLIHAIQASSLLGSQSILVGIRPEMAQTLVGLGLDFSGLLVQASLQQGLEYAMRNRRQGWSLNGR